MARKLNQREKRVILIGAISAVAIFAFTWGADWLKGWGEARADLARAKSRLEEIEADRAKQAALLSIVPVFEVPQPDDRQRFLFRDKLLEQFKKAGINTEPLQIFDARRTKAVPYKVLKVRCKGKCKFDQLLSFLASAPESPFLVGVEEFRIQCDPKEAPDKRKEVEVDLTVSTFVE